MRTAAVPARSDRADLSRVRVAVLFGGASTEREISLVTGRSILAGLAAARERDPRAPAEVQPIEIDERNRWIVAGSARAPEEALAALDGIDVFFLGLHGGQGEDGTIQGLLAACGKRFTGSGVAASSACMDKLAARAIASAAGMGVAPGLCIDREAWTSRPALPPELASITSPKKPGWVVKPRRGGSSVATSIVHAPSELAAAIDAVVATDDDALIESCVEGVELTAPVLGDGSGVPRALPCVEIRPAAGRFFDYQQKYAADGAREICPPESVPPEVCERVQSLGLAAHRALGCAGYSRSDFIVPREGGACGAPVFLETNTLPGLTPRSLVPQSAASAGIDHPELCLCILREALRS